VDFLSVLIELFSLGVTAEALRAIICSKSAISLQRGPVDPKFQVDLSSVLSQFTRLTDRQTDGQSRSSDENSVCLSVRPSVCLSNA